MSPFNPQAFAGLRDTAGVLRGLAPGNEALAELDADLADAPPGWARRFALLQRVTPHATRIVASLAAGETERSRGPEPAADCEDHLEDLRILAPWWPCGSRAPAGARAGEPGLEDRPARPDLAPTLREVAKLGQLRGPSVAAAPEPPRRRTGPDRRCRPL